MLEIENKQVSHLALDGDLLESALVVARHVGAVLEVEADLRARVRARRVGRGAVGRAPVLQRSEHKRRHAQLLEERLRF